MDGRKLKLLIDAGDYHPVPEQVAKAMLRRRAVRELLIGAASLDFDVRRPNGLGASLSSAGRIRPASASPRQAA